MIQRCVDRELALEDLAVDHGNQSRAEIVGDLNQLASFYLLIIFDRLSLLALQILVLRIEASVKR